MSDPGPEPRPDVSSPANLLSSTRPSFAEDRCSRAISLVDGTRASDPGQTPPHSEPLGTPIDRQPTEASLVQRLNRGTLREEMARRKYRRFQEDRYDVDEGVGGSSGLDEEAPKDVNKKVYRRHRDRIRDKMPFRSKKAARASEQDEYEIDILYENQRGLFFCGIPLYSSKSLLNLDPAPWQTKNFKESPVNITNAQLPNPSWVWSWKCWYVDMSHDVDEEGWEYSFSFQKGFSWHGTHPWFYSWVRRRRWLRKRVKVDSDTTGRITEAHRLNDDYFTIHSAKRDESPGSSVAKTSNHKASYLTTQTVESEDLEDEEISNINALLGVLKRAAVDRKKINAIRNFLEHAGDEVHYLPEHMDQIMSLFMYQASRRQMVSELQQDVHGLEEHSHSPIEENGDDQSTAKRRADALRRAIEAVEHRIKDLEYWSDVKAVVSEPEALEEETGPVKGTSEPPASDNELEKGTSLPPRIKGIPEGAGIGEEPGIARPEGTEGADRSEAKEKGKGKALD